MEYERVLSQFDYAEIRIEQVKESLVTLKDDEIKHTTGSSKGMSVRILENGSWGFSSSNRLKIEDLISRARKLAALSKGKIRIETAKPEKTETGKLYDSSSEDQIKTLLEASRSMKEKGISSRGISATDSHAVSEYHNSEGASIIQKTSHSYLSCVAIAKSDGQMQRGGARSSSRTGFDALKILETAEEAKQKSLRLLNAKAPPKGRFTVVFDPEMTGVFAHESVGHACEADAVADKESILAERKGEKIGSEIITIYDDPTAKDFGHYEFDDEGVRAEKTVLISNGSVNAWINSRETAASTDTVPNGHARAEDFAEVPVVRMSNTYVEKGNHTLEEVFDIKQGIYLKGMRGGSVDTFSGGFMFKAEEAYEIKNGEKGAIMRDATITGNILQTLRDVEAVGKDFGTSPGMCGKSGQSVPVSDGGPHIRVKGVAVG